MAPGLIWCVGQVRKTRDPIELSKSRILEAGFMTKEEMKAMEKEVGHL